LTTISKEISFKENELTKTLFIEEKKVVKMIHTFNVKTSRQSQFLSRHLFEKNDENAIKESIFQKKKSSKKNSIFDSSKMSPVLTFNSPTLVESG
jgi:hypothetical protein